MSHTKPTHIFGVASCLGAQNEHCEFGPMAIRQRLEAKPESFSDPLEWTMISPQAIKDGDKTKLIEQVCTQLASNVEKTMRSGERFIVLGGDHSCAIGTWNGVRSYLAPAKLGLIWIDAHMDSHLPETSPSQAIHGMPLACLIGHGELTLRKLNGFEPTVLPKNVCLIGIRSYEPEESAFLDLLGVKVFSMHDVRKLGLKTVMSQAIEIAKNGTQGFGISIDLDAIDPEFAPGVGSPSENGINPSELMESLKTIKHDEQFVGGEITEYNPGNDHQYKTADIAIQLMNLLQPEA